jgi:hypothetical protein
VNIGRAFYDDSKRFLNCDGIGMKHYLYLCTAFVLASVCFGAEIKPVDSRNPVFRIYLGFSSRHQERMVRGPQVAFDARRPSLVVWSVRDVRLTPDRKGVVLGLNDKDTKTFATLTRKFTGGLLIVEGQGSVLTALHVTEPLNTGVLEFKDPDDANVVQYLRRRFNLR